MSELMTQTEAREVLARALAALKKAGADDGRARLGGGASRNMRFARNGITTNGNVRGMKLTLYASVGKRSASIASNRLDDESMAKMAAEVVANARVLPENREHMPTLDAQTYEQVQAWFRETADLGPQQLATTAGKVVTAARAQDVTAAGYATSGSWFRAVATYNGVFAQHRSSRVRLTATTRTSDGTGSGWATSFARRTPDLDVDHVADGSIRRALGSRNPQALEPGAYPVILEPQAVADIVDTLRWTMDARAADEGRSFFSGPGGTNKIGARIWDTPISLRTDPVDPRTLSSPFDDEGLPRRRTTWVENGVLRELPYTRYWAKKNAREPLAWPSSWLVEGKGDPTSLEEMIASVQRAILITRLWYLRMVDPRQVLVTGLTRDGTFLVEDGKITKALKNFRFNESPVDVFQRTQKFSNPQVVGSGTAVPALSVSKFRFTSLSEAV